MIACMNHLPSLTGREASEASPGSLLPSLNVLDNKGEETILTHAKNCFQENLNEFPPIIEGAMENFLAD